MTQQRSHQMRLPLTPEVPPDRIPTKHQQEARRLLSQLMLQVISENPVPEETDDEREDSTDAS